jgi:predicted nucleic acid-binding Zn ribbon protein
MNELSELLPKLLQQLPFSSEMAENVVCAVWGRAVGEPIALRTKPFKLHKSTLIVSVPSQAWKKELGDLQEEILQKLSKTLGKRVVYALEFRVDETLELTPRSQPLPIESKTSIREESPALGTVADPELNRSLAAAATSYFNRPK